MVFFLNRHMCVLMLLGLLLAATTVSAQLSQTAFAKIDALQRLPDSAGALVYRGDTFSQRSTAGTPLYRYERRVVSASTGVHASHITSDPVGRVIIVEASILTPNYEVQRFEVMNQQSGFSGAVQVSNDGRHLEYELNDKGKVSKASEDVSQPVVCGPSLFGFILKNWDTLRAGTAIPVRLLVIQEKTTYGFDIRFENLVDGQTSFSITPSNFLVRLAIAPLRVVIDANTRTVVRYEGRVPPMENVSGKLKDLDARVEYTSVSAKYL